MALLSSIDPNLLSEISIKILRKNNIFNILDFVQEDVTKLINMTKLTYKEVLNVRLHIFKTYGAVLINGNKYHAKLLSSFAILPTCIEELDEMLQGGLHCGKITEVCSLPNSGKTQLALSIASNISSKLKQNVLFIDTKCDFSGKRMHQILLEKCGNDSEIAENLDRIKVIRLFDIKSVIQFLQSLQHNEIMKTIRLVIIDSLPALMLQFLGEKVKESLGLLNHFVNITRFIGVEYNVPFIVTNLLTRWVVSTPIDNDGAAEMFHTVEINPALGKYWSHIPYTSIHIVKPSNFLGTIQINLKTFNYYTSVKNVTLNLSSKGVT